MSDSSAKPGPATNGAERARHAILGVPVDAVSSAVALDRVKHWAATSQSRYVTFCNVHSVVTASGDSRFRTAINGADLAAPDGAPVAWMLRRLGVAAQRRVSGPDFMLDYLAGASVRGEPIYLYGSTEATLSALERKLKARFPTLVIAGSRSPPFHPATPAEDADDVARINASGARTVWVSLGCPKQEQWMAAHRGHVQAVMIGVGAAFDFHAGTVARAPRWMRATGLEWLHRVLSEPRRLWKRYLVTNSAFIAGVMRQLLTRQGSAPR